MGFVVDIMILKETQYREGSHIFVISNMKIQISNQIELQNICLSFIIFNAANSHENNIGTD